MAVTTSDTFSAWLDTVDDDTAHAAILVRLMRLARGNLGDFKTFGGVTELRIDVGAGYRVYVMRDGADDWLVLSGGDKSSQKRDIPKAQALAAEVKGAKAVATAAAKRTQGKPREGRKR